MPTPSATDPPSPTPADVASERPANGRPSPHPRTDAAARALAEAVARRTERDKAGADETQAANEVGGRGGLDPVRYGDWEINGLASDF